MKKIIGLQLIVLLFVGNQIQAQKHQLIQKWQTDTLLKVPESVFFDEANKVLYVANIDGAPDGKDGKGSVGKVGLDGKIIAVDWVTGLNAPKGMGLYNNKLYVADLDAVVIIDIKAGKILKRVPIEGAVFLNDITVDKKGVVYISDTRVKKVYKMENEVVSVLVENLQGPNGLLSNNGNFYILDNGSMLKLEKDKKLTKIADGMEPQTDGLVNVKGQEFIISCWPGTVYYINADGSKEKLLDTRDQKINSADIAFDPKTRTVYVPTFFKNSIVAYQLK